MKLVLDIKIEESVFISTAVEICRNKHSHWLLDGNVKPGSMGWAFVKDIMDFATPIAREYGNLMCDFEVSTVDGVRICPLINKGK